MGKCTSIADSLNRSCCYIDLESHSVLYYFEDAWQIGRVRRKAGKSYIIEKDHSIVHLNNRNARYVSQGIFAYYAQRESIEFPMRSDRSRSVIVR